MSAYVRKGGLSLNQRGKPTFFVYRIKSRFSVERRNPNPSPTWKIRFGFLSFGPSDRIRTCGILLPNVCQTFNRHSTALFGAFRCFGNSSLELFGPACFKNPFRLLGFVWDWILYIKRCSVRPEGKMTGQLPQRSGAGNAPHKQRIRPWRGVHSP